MHLDANPLSGAELAAFAAAVDAGTVGGAAEALGLTQSAVTKRLQSLEARLGVRLFDRGRAGVTPTVAAQTMYPEARNALDALRRVEQAAAAPDAAGALRLPIAASFTLGEFLLPAWLAAFRLAEPRLRASVDVKNSPAVLADVRAGRAALGFVEGLDDLRGLRTARLLRDELRVTVAPDHRWARRRTVRTADLHDEPYVAREPGSGTRTVADAALARVGVALQPTLEVSSTQGIVRALATGGFAICSEHAVADGVREGTLATLGVQGVDLHRDLTAVHGGRTPPTPIARAFWRWLADQTGTP